MKPTAERSLTGARGGVAEQSGWRVGRPGRRRSLPEPLEHPGWQLRTDAGMCLAQRGGGASVCRLEQGPLGHRVLGALAPPPSSSPPVDLAVQPRGRHSRQLPATAAQRAATQPQASAPLPPPPPQQPSLLPPRLPVRLLGSVLSFPFSSSRPLTATSLHPLPPAICRAPLTLALQGARR